MTAGIGLYDGYTLKVITVDRNGNPAFVGSILYSKYQKIEKIKRLLKLGDLHELKENLNPLSSIGHYILKSKDKIEELRLQEGVTISKYRDIREIEDGIVKKNKVVKPREYTNIKVAYICEGVDYLYVYNTITDIWTTWGFCYVTNCFDKIKVDYRLYVKNLVYREDISPLSKEEKKKLNYFCK